MSCTKQTVESPKQDDTKRSEGWLNLGACHERTRWAGQLEGELLFISNGRLSSRISTGRDVSVSSCQGRNSEQTNNEDVVGGARCIL